MWTGGETNPCGTRLSRACPMIVPVVSLGHMRVIMSQRQVPVQVSVWLGRDVLRAMLMPVVIFVLMSMVVFRLFMKMLMRVMFPEK
ncbi:MAG: hypothetical protein ACREIS_01780 [Nitrospiraceae bacterium]